MVIDFEKSNFRYSLTIPVAELGKEIKITMWDLVQDEYLQEDGFMRVTVNLEYNGDVFQWERCGSTKGKRFVEIAEEILFVTIRMTKNLNTAYYEFYELPRLPSTCGFFNRYTFRKLCRWWIREHAEFSLDVQGEAKDGSVLRAKYSGGDGTTAKIYCGEEFLGTITMRGSGKEDEWSEEADILSSIEGIDKDEPPEGSFYASDWEYWRKRYKERLALGECYTGRRAEDFSDELARIESFYLSRKWITKDMEQALSGGAWSRETETAIADQKVIAAYYHDYECEQPDWRMSYKEVRFRYYIVKGQRHKEGGWRLLGLFYRGIWQWGTIFVGECAGEPCLPRLPAGAMRMPGIFGQRLEDVLKESGTPGWEAMICGRDGGDLWEGKHSIDPEWRQEAGERLAYLSEQGLDRQAAEWFGQGSAALCLQGGGTRILQWENIPNILETVRQCEEEYGICVYYAMGMFLFSNLSLAMLYVGPSREEWEYERQELKKQIPTVVTCTFDREDVMTGRELGSTRIKIVDGGVIRIS